MAKSKHNTLTRRAALTGGASVIALAGAAAVAAVPEPDPEVWILREHTTARLVRLSAIVQDLRGISTWTPSGTYWAVQAVANRIERDIFGIEPEPLPFYVTMNGYQRTETELEKGGSYRELFAKIGGAS